MNKTLVQDLIPQIQSKLLTELHLVLGGLPGQTPADTFVRESDGILARRIALSEKALIANNNIWQYGKIYDQWSPDISSNYYVYNTENRIVYLCTDNRPNNRLDEEPGLSTQLPSHTDPVIQEYSDGYSWIPVFRVDFTKLEFLSQTDLPIPDIANTTVFSSFSDVYSSLCGSGITGYGCCCLYFKENSVDEVTGEVYTKGDVTNEVIFSDCYECQKLADALNREVVFLPGVTSGQINSSHPSENPLCPATKTIKTIKQTLQDQQYTLIPGSSQEYALTCLNGFSNDGGILAARIDLTGLTEAQRTISTENATVTLLDKHGTGAVVRLKTQPAGYNQHLVIGIELVQSGTGYTTVTDWIAPNSSIYNAITLVNFPDEFYNDPTHLIHPVRLRTIVQVSDTELDNNVSTESFTKFALLANPLQYTTQSPKIFAPEDKSFTNLQTFVFGATGPITIIE